MKLRQYIEVLLLRIPAYHRLQLKKTENHTKKVATQIRAELVEAVKILKKINFLMTQQGMSRAKRKQFWNDFLKYDNVREDVFDNLLRYYDINTKPKK